MIRTMTALIVDDEALARRRLRDLTGKVEWVECVGEAANAKTALAALEHAQPDLMFLDIRMPGMSGIEMLSHVRHRPAVVFTTAYDQFAVTAFELGALDYLLKPFGEERFLRALERVRATLARGQVDDPTVRLQEAISGDQLTRLFLRDGARVVPVPLSAVEWLEACDDYVVVHCGKRDFTISLTMNDLERRLDPRVFVRVHRSSIVNLDHVASWEPFDGSRFQVTLRGGKTLIASRHRARQLRGIGS